MTMEATFIRYYAATNDTATGRVALEYLKSLVRVAPVRVLSTTGGLSGAWAGFHAVLATPVSYPLVNVVCSTPNRWTWTQRVDAMRTQRVDAMPQSVGASAHITSVTVPPKAERIEGRLELYTKDIRNVLLAADEPADMDQLATALKYETIVVPSEALLEAWQRARRGAVLVPIPVTGHDVLRSAVLGED
jgi:hypothetical protein